MLISIKSQIKSKLQKNTFLVKKLLHLNRQNSNFLCILHTIIIDGTGRQIAKHLIIEQLKVEKHCVKKIPHVLINLIPLCFFTPFSLSVCLCLIYYYPSSYGENVKKKAKARKKLRQRFFLFPHRHLCVCIIIIHV